LQRQATIAVSRNGVHCGDLGLRRVDQPPLADGLVRQATSHPNERPSAGRRWSGPPCDLNAGENGRVWRELPRLVPALSDGSEPRPESVGSKYALYEEIVEYVRLAAATCPLVLVLDDMQWADSATWDTLEHLPHPERFLAKIAELLPAGGWLFLTTGDIGAPVARRGGERWRMIHPPTHLQYFSRETLRRFLARHGLRTVHIESTPMCRSLYGTLEGLQRFAAGPARGFAGVVSRLVPRALARRLRFTVDLGDIMLACARKG